MAHSAGLGKEAAIRMAISTARNVLAGLDREPDPSMIVNREVPLTAEGACTRNDPLDFRRGASGRDTNWHGSHLEA
jgi:hypothetical protein